MDQITAHLDRGWDLVQRGETQGAQESARRALELDPESPEAHNLLGYAAALQGDIEDALDAYEQAIVLDETYVEAMLNAAELYLHPLGEYDEVIGLCQQALELSEYQDEIVDAMMLQLEALIGKGDTDGARKLLSRVPPGPYEHAAQTFLVARAHYELGQLAAAAELLEAALVQDPDHADAWYYAGLVREEQGDRRAAIDALLRSREFDVAGGMPPWAPAPDALKLLTEQAIHGLAPELAAQVDGAAVYVASLPGAEVVVDGVDPRASALIEAVPLGEEGASPEGRDVRVFVYALNVLKAAGGPHAIEGQIRTALEIEIRAVFGLPASTPAAGANAAPVGA
jgi:Tfp pilus assembly protein PilF